MSIGPKCSLCGKNISHHGPAPKRRCPVGKKVNGVYPLSVDKFFVPREPRKRKGSEGNKMRRRSRKFTPAMKRIRDEGCCACGQPGRVEIHHVLRRSQGGSNHQSNLLPLCAGCHTQEPWAWHRNLARFFFKFPHVWEKRLAPRGWEKVSERDWKLIPPPEARSTYMRAITEAKCTA